SRGAPALRGPKPTSIPAAPRPGALTRSYHAKSTIHDRGRGPPGRAHRRRRAAPRYRHRFVRPDPHADTRDGSARCHRARRSSPRRPEHGELGDRSARRAREGEVSKVEWQPTHDALTAALVNAKGTDLQIGRRLAHDLGFKGAMYDDLFTPKVAAAEL